MAGVDSGKLAPLIEDVAVLVLQPVGVEFPSAVTAIVPVVLPLPGANGVVVGGVSGIVVVVAIVPIAAVVAAVVAMLVDSGAAVTSGGTGIGGAVTSPSVAVEVADTAATGAGCAASVVGPPMVPSAGVDAIVAAVGVTATGAVAGKAVVADAGSVEQLTLVPGVVGSRASGSGASVVSSAPGWVAAENGLGPFSGDDTIAPGVDEIPIAVVPMVETCATQAVPPSSSAAVAHNRRRIIVSRQLVGPAGWFRRVTLLPSARFTIGLRIT